MPSEGRRSRQQRELRTDIVLAARRRLEDGGPTTVTLRGIARDVGVSGPALYTYFASLAELFTELIVDSYRSLAADVAAAVEAVAERDLGERLRAGPIAYRRWAIEHRQQFNLIFFDQIVGYTAPPGGPTVDAQTDVLRPIANEYATARGFALDDVERDDELLDEFLAWWGAFHGIVALEVNHHLDWRNPEVIFHRHLDRSVATLTEG